VRWFLPVVILQYIYTAVYGMSPPLSTRIPGPSISRRRGMDRNRLSGRPFIMLLHSYSFEFSALSEALFSCQTCRRLTVGRSEADFHVRGLRERTEGYARPTD
jgi:hypothetical protein